MLWGCFSAGRNDRLHKIHVIMSKEHYVEMFFAHDEHFKHHEQILKHLKTSTSSDTKHTAKLVIKWFTNKKRIVLVWPSYRPDLTL